MADKKKPVKEEPVVQPEVTPEPVAPQVEEPKRVVIVDEVKQV